MRTIIAGSRSIKDIKLVYRAVAFSDYAITQIVSGTASGVDKLGEEYARNMGIPVVRFPADWDLHGKSAGYIRNKEMADNADALIAIWDGASKGTKHMIDIAKQKGLKVFTVLLGKYKPDSSLLGKDIQWIQWDELTKAH